MTLHFIKSKKEVFLNQIAYWVASLMLLIPICLYAKPPAFDNYPAQNYHGKNQALKLNVKTQKFKTLFKEMSKQKPNFAGQYVLQEVGCGGGCSFALVYNAKTGQSLILPETFAECYSEAKGFTANEIVYKNNSRLLLAIGSRHGEQSKCEKVYYLVKNDHFQVIDQMSYYASH